MNAFARADVRAALAEAAAVGLIHDRLGRGRDVQHQWTDRRENPTFTVLVDREGLVIEVHDRTWFANGISVLEALQMLRLSGVLGHCGYCSRWTVTPDEFCRPCQKKTGAGVAA